jgi:hypothetical protein
MKRYILLAGILCTVLAGSLGCRSAYYAAYEKLGVYKRDLLKKEVVKARDEQADAQQEFKDALTRLKEITKFDGGNVEKTYNALKSDHDDCASRAEAVRKRIQDVETVADDLFVEWEKEIAEISTASLRDSSQDKLRSTKLKYEEMHRALKSAEKTMDPVLRLLNDYVLFLKHNLNAQAVASLKGEALNITTEINRLIEAMNTAISRADEFVKSMP